MSSFTPEQWQQASPYLDEALELTAEKRNEWLSSLRTKDASLASMLQALLEEQQQLHREGFLETPPLLASMGLAGQQIGAYTLINEIGQGGMGTVWLARRSDGRFERHAAVKFVNLALAGQGSELRFRREGSILGRLTHPHVAELFDAGISSGGQPYLILEYVDGMAIDQYCDQHKLDVEARVRLFLDVLEAVAYAHSNLIVHRDIKPSNVLVTQTGQVKLLDFGIAKLLQGDGQTGAATLLTREIGAALTPQYAAPEQMKNLPVTTATDVYALGVLLYVLLGGHHPAGPNVQSPAELIKAVLETEPRRLSDSVAAGDGKKVSEYRKTTSEKLQRQLRGDLDTIIGKAIKKDPSERYASVSAFADDLNRYLERRPIRARPDAM
ncbi:MAG: serine/threonine-protein kinase, partial [Candidatus Sulfotelmatobacter sp.]